MKMSILNIADIVVAFKKHAADGLAGMPGRIDVALWIMNDFRKRANVKELREFATEVGVGSHGTRNQIGERLVSYAIGGPAVAAKTDAAQKRRALLEKGR